MYRVAVVNVIHILGGRSTGILANDKWGKALCWLDDTTSFVSDFQQTPNSRPRWTSGTTPLSERLAEYKLSLFYSLLLPLIPLLVWPWLT